MSIKTKMNAIKLKTIIFFVFKWSRSVTVKG